MLGRNASLSNPCCRNPCPTPRIPPVELRQLCIGSSSHAILKDPFKRKNAILIMHHNTSWRNHCCYQHLMVMIITNFDFQKKVSCEFILKKCPCDHHSLSFAHIWSTPCLRSFSYKRQASICRPTGQVNHRRFDTTSSYAFLLRRAKGVINAEAPSIGEQRGCNSSTHSIFLN